MTFSHSPSRIAIIGGGVSGTLLAAQILRQTRTPAHVFLIDRTGEFGRGIAYRTRCPDHRLNVPAGRMGAFPDEPDGFFQWLRAHAGRPDIPANVGPDDFVPRHLFGSYIQDILIHAEDHAVAGSALEKIKGEAIDAEETPDHLIVRLKDERTLTVDHVVLALGNLPGEYPIPRPLPVYDHPRYVHIPWLEDALEGLSDTDDVLLVGQGLTAIDLMVQLHHRGHRGTIHSLSRHGVRPQVHRVGLPPWNFVGLENVKPNVRAWTRYVREQIVAAQAAGQDWRAVIDGLRSHTQTIWQSWSWEDRARFLRHVRPFWDAHRHRVPAETAAVVERMANDGRLIFHAGRLQLLEASGAGLHALLRQRGSIRHLSLQVAKVINCTGARTDYTKYQHPLLIHLLARGLIGHDVLALGINALPSGEVIRYRGEPSSRLFTLGAPLKGTLWESTAVREIRAQAESLARRLISLEPALA